MRAESRLDHRGRITIHQPFRRMFRQRVVQILTPHGILLRPVPDTLVHDGRLPSAIEASGDDAALEEIEEELETIHGRKPRRSRS